ncbi:methyltransferase domain-containing protein [Corallococcus sp. CA047B]|uniref:CheR family methyltransferase n=1 Tax=Corallococcus sp. CA047B TaxID=2316729 RepID=UPI000EA0E3C3|nr:CheR family methyltransferase [Corallococcus sp. CA047B]RKH19184.1 methyltransferase domain-containing protein [Corallococcus sp. CA047B]
MALSAAQRRRLDARLEALGREEQAAQVVSHLRSRVGAADLARLVGAVAVHTSEVFRDEVQLAAFREHVLSPRVQRSKLPLRVWSAGCAAGEEVATLLVLLAQEGADPASRVLGTDISEQVLNRARELSFPADALRRVPDATRARYFQHRGGRQVLVESLRTQAGFRRHNLMELPYPEAEGGGGFDVIFCRNVLIYFTPEAFQRTVRNLSEQLAPGGVLVLSAAEPLLQVPPSLRLLPCEQAFFYVRVDEAEVSAPGSRRGSGRFPAVPEPAAPKRDSGRFPSVTGPAAPKRDSGRFPAVPDEGASPSDVGRSSPEPTDVTPKRDSGRFPAVPPFAVLGHVSDPEPDAVPHGPPFAAEALASTMAEADWLFSRVLDGASTGVSDTQAEDDLRRCLDLDPDHVAARYLLGLLLEQCGRPDAAVGEYRRARDAVDSGRARPVPFLLNLSRLRVACARAVERLEAEGQH